MMESTVADAIQEKKSIGSIPELIETNSPLATSESKVIPGRVYRSDFKVLKFLGKGSYGKVYQVCMKTPERPIYAMKAVRKGEIKDNECDIVHTRTERDVLTTTDHPFIVKMHYAFETKSKVYLIQEFLRGGELFSRIEKETMFLEDVAKFYLCEIILALEYLHGLDIIYRDLKSENILLARDGHIKLIDFGLSKMGVDKDNLATTFCGTVEYMAPEVINRKGHGKPADWWSLGTFAFDILNGFPPFHSQNRQKLFEKIKKSTINFPSYMTPDAKDLIRKLLRKCQNKRLGSNNGSDVKSHPFFRDIEWDKVYKRLYKPPYSPSAISDEDVSEFDTRFTSCSPRESVDSMIEDSFDERDALFDDFWYSSTLTSDEDDEIEADLRDDSNEEDSSSTSYEDEKESNDEITTRLHRGHGP
ncbi:RPS6KB [Lepeophtheirus salmonis]|uniref:RPS6KB n=1 Tax=Lepeophtheirus salmonis TaxID=72036 RepID=A0A7R8GZZ4_LEPSM|nr:RPS6KB [Lepeophtheirus salmonis]CAF2774681.1 RPS6KB [Lepeophtheirus salmonis]